MRRHAYPILALLAGALVPAPGASAACRTPVDGMPADRRAAVHECTGARPGMTMLAYSERRGTYTMCGATFAFRDQFGHRYLSTVGTCVLDFECLEDVVTALLPPPLDRTVRDIVCLKPGESETELYAKRGGRPIRDAHGVRIGELVYGVNKDRVDFAIVRLDKKVRLDPSVPIYGGPVAIGAPPAVPEEGFVYSLYKHPLGPNARSALLWGDAAGAHVLTDTTFSSGGAVLRSDGRAVGYVGASGDERGYNVALIGHALERTYRRTGLRLTLLTAPLA